MKALFDAINHSTVKENDWLDISLFKDVMLTSEKRNIIFNGGKPGSDSYYIREYNDVEITNCGHLLMMESSSSAPFDDVVLSESHFIDHKFDEIVNNRIKIAVRDQFSAQITDMNSANSQNSLADNSMEKQLILS